MGLGASGKSSIRSVVFDGKNPREVQTYDATLNYVRSRKNILGNDYQIYDCGGQEAFLSTFVGEQAEFIFSDVEVLIWTVDAGNFQQASTSKFYFDHAIWKLKEYSPNAVVFCLFHKMDLIVPDMWKNVISTMKLLFTPPVSVDIIYHGTSIYDRTIFETFEQVLQRKFSQTEKKRTLTEAIEDIITETEGQAGINLQNQDGITLFEFGPLIEKARMMAKEWRHNFTRIRKELGPQEHLKSTIETDEFYIIHQNAKDGMLLTGIVKKVVPFEYVLVKLDELSEMIHDQL